MHKDKSERDGEERRKSLNLRLLLDRLDDRTADLYERFAVLSSQVAQVRDELKQLRQEAPQKESIVRSQERGLLHRS